jgi:hypothetical protein
VSFKESLIILTSNVGSRVIAKGGLGQIGFHLESGRQAEETASSKRLQALVHDELKNHFRPELLNRLDEIVVCCCFLFHLIHVVLVCWCNAKHEDAISMIANTEHKAAKIFSPSGLSFLPTKPGTCDLPSGLCCAQASHFLCLQIVIIEMR